VSVVCCQIEVSAPDHSSVGVLRRMLRLSEISKLSERTDHDWNRGRSATGKLEINIFGVLNVKYVILIA